MQCRRFMVNPNRITQLASTHLRSSSTDAPPIIMITANEGSRHKAYAEYLGVVDYIRKPFAMERLLEAVARGLDGKLKKAEGEATE